MERTADGRKEVGWKKGNDWMKGGDRSVGIGGGKVRLQTETRPVRKR